MAEVIITREIVYLKSRGNNNIRPSNTQNNYARQPTNYNSPGIMKCTYCNIPGHDVSRCYKKQNTERGNNNNLSGNLKGSDDTEGARPINLIAAMGEDQCNVYTSCQS